MNVENVKSENNFEQTTNNIINTREVINDTNFYIKKTMTNSGKI